MVGVGKAEENVRRVFIVVQVKDSYYFEGGIRRGFQPSISFLSYVLMLSSSRVCSSELEIPSVLCTRRLIIFLGGVAGVGRCLFSRSSVIFVLFS